MTDTFREAIHSAGLEPPARIEPGRFHRFPGANKRKGNTAGWCRLFPDGRGGVFGDWSTGLHQTWQAEHDRPFTDQEREDFRRLVEEARRQAEELRQGERAAAAAKARTRIEQAPAANPGHPYLERKGIGTHGARQDGGLLLLPMIDPAGELSAVQTIDQDGAKLFWPAGCSTAGASFQIGKPPAPGEPVLIAEGFATAAAIHESTGHLAIVAFCAGNLERTASTIQALHPGHPVIVCADDDTGTEGNPGITAATVAARAVGGKLAVPGMGRRADFWDLRAEGGPEAVRAALAAAMDIPADQAGQEQPAAELIDIQPLDLDAAIDNPPEPIHWHVDNYLLHGIVGIMTGTGGVGKSFEVIAMAVAKATGHEIPPFSASEPGRVLLLNVEDPDRELSRRVHHFAKTYPLSDGERALLRKNLIVLPGRGKVRPFMKLEYGSPVEDASFRWFTAMVEQYDPELIFLDTKSRLYGLEENSTDHATRWLGLFERLLVPRPEMSIMVVSHTSKANAQSESAHADRGGSGFPDNARCVLVLCRPQDADLKKLGQDADPQRFAKLVVAKQSYGPEAPPVFFEKDEHGVPVLVELRDTEAEARSAALDQLVDILRTEHPDGLGKRALERLDDETCKNLRREIIDTAGITAGDWKPVIQLGIESGRLIVETEQCPDNRNKRQVVKARTTTEWRQDTACQHDLF